MLSFNDLGWVIDHGEDLAPLLSDYQRQVGQDSEEMLETLLPLCYHAGQTGRVEYVLQIIQTMREAITAPDHWLKPASLMKLIRARPFPRQHQSEHFEDNLSAIEAMTEGLAPPLVLNELPSCGEDAEHLVKGNFLSGCLCGNLAFYGTLAKRVPEGYEALEMALLGTWILYIREYGRAIIRLFEDEFICSDDFARQLKRYRYSLCYLSTRFRERYPQFSDLADEVAALYLEVLNRRKAPSLGLLSHRALLLNTGQVQGSLNQDLVKKFLNATRLFQLLMIAPKTPHISELNLLITDFYEALRSENTLNFAKTTFRECYFCEFPPEFLPGKIPLVSDFT